RRAAQSARQPFPRERGAGGSPGTRSVPRRRGRSLPCRDGTAAAAVPVRAGRGAAVRPGPRCPTGRSTRPGPAGPGTSPPGLCRARPAGAGRSTGTPPGGCAGPALRGLCSPHPPSQRFAHTFHIGVVDRLRVDESCHGEQGQQGAEDTHVAELPLVVVPVLLLASGRRGEVEGDVLESVDRVQPFPSP